MPTPLPAWGSHAVYHETDRVVSITPAGRHTRVVLTQHPYPLYLETARLTAALPARGQSVVIRWEEYLGIWVYTQVKCGDQVFYESALPAAPEPPRVADRSAER